jgi:tetratricopeptide (TPR) repeat protein/predicted Ser/Thr protein kinase
MAESRFSGFSSDFWGAGDPRAGEATVSSLVGTTVGHIRLEALLGAGGMGEVYRGFDETLQRVVAVKTIRAEHRLSGTARSRFLREARILSKLADPAICQVYDLVESPEADFLVLEFVEGETLDRLRDRGELDERRVLEIGARIAEALVVAHKEKIIHRDLKPANIMLLPSGAVKVLDFGIARSTAAETVPRPGGEGARSGAAGAGVQTPLPPAPADAESTRVLDAEREPSGSFSAALTQQGSIVGTLRYMSPEQAAGQELTEASDLFSLAIVLQELLTGKSAYPDEPMPQLLLRVYNCESLPIEGVDPDVARLVEDLKHPTPARRPTAAQTLERLRWILEKPQRLRRRRLQMAALAASFVLLVLVLAVVSYLAVREKRARAKAERLAVELEREAQRANREATTANRVVEFLVEVLEEADPEKARGREVTVREAVAVGGRRILDRLGEEPRVRARLEDTLGGVTWRLGDLDGAVILLEEARRTLERESGAETPELAETLTKLGAVYIDLERFDEAGRALANARRILEAQPEPPVGDLARALNLLGALAFAQGELERAEEFYSRSLALLRSPATPAARDVALALNNLAILAWRRADFATAESRYRESLALNEELLGANHPHLAAQLNNLGILARDQGKLDEAERLHRRALGIAEAALGPEHPDVASILNSLARLYARQNRSGEGIALLERSLAICRSAYGESHAETGTTLVRLGDLERRAGRRARAGALIARGLATLTAALGADHPRLVEAWRALGEQRRDEARAREAAEAFREALRIGRAALGADHPDVRELEREVASLGELAQTPGRGGTP